MSLRRSSFSIASVDLLAATDLLVSSETKATRPGTTNGTSTHGRQVAKLQLSSIVTEPRITTDTSWWLAPIVVEEAVISIRTTINAPVGWLRPARPVVLTLIRRALYVRSQVLVDRYKESCGGLIVAGFCFRIRRASLTTNGTKASGSRIRGSAGRCWLRSGVHYCTEHLLVTCKLAT